MVTKHQTAWDTPNQGTGTWSDPVLLETIRSATAIVCAHIENSGGRGAGIAEDAGTFLSGLYNAVRINDSGKKKDDLARPQG